MKKYFFSFLLFPVLLNAQNFNWAKNSGGTGMDFGCGVKTDVAGNSYIAGSFTGTGTFGTQVLNSAGGKDVFVAKYNVAGVCQWAIAEGGTLDDEAGAIYADAAGNIYVSGQYDGTALFGNVTLSSSSGMFLAKYDSAGVFQWVRQFGNGGNEYAWAVTADNNGNTFVAGYITGTAIIGTDTFTTPGGYADTYIAKYSPNGNFIWAKQMGSPDVDLAYGIATDLNGNVFATGRFAGTAQFGTITLSSTSSFTNDVFIVALDGNGNYLWAVKGGSTADDSGQSIATDASGYIYITGYFRGTATFGTTIMSSSGGMDFFVAAYNSSGGLQWVRRAGSTSDDYGSGICTSPSGDIFATGFYNGTVSFGSTLLTSAGGRDVFVCKLDAAGNFTWSLGGGGTSDEYGRNIGYSGGRIFICGLASGTGNYGTNTLLNFGQDDVFLACIADVDVGVNENDADFGMNIYPNPFFNNAVICISENLLKAYPGLNLDIFDEAGRKCAHEEIVGTRTPINRAGFDNGLYIYVLSDENGIIKSGRLVIGQE
jgi:hypothetical protein